MYQKAFLSWMHELDFEILRFYSYFYLYIMIIIISIPIQDRTRQDIYYHNITSTIFGTQLARKRSSRRAKLILLQIRYYIIISEKQRKKRRNMCNEFKSKKDKSV